MYFVQHNHTYKVLIKGYKYFKISDAGTGEGLRGATEPQYLADQLILFQPGEGRLSTPITTGPQFFHLPAPLSYGSQKII